jgi:hypothetical protein
MNRIRPTRSDPEYHNNNGKFTLIEGSEAGYVGHNFGRAFVSMESGKGASRAVSELHGVACVVPFFSNEDGVLIVSGAALMAR